MHQPPPSYPTQTTDFDAKSVRVGHGFDEQQRQSLEDEPTFRALIVHWAENTGMHGLPNISKSGSMYKRTFWTLLLLAGMGLMITLITGIITKYYNFPSSLHTGTSIRTEQDFPAVTVCNRNPANFHKLQASLSEAGRKRRSATGDENSRSNADKYSSLTGSVYTDATTRNLSAMSSDTIPDSLGMTYTFLDYFSSLTTAEKIEIGYQIDDFLVECVIASNYCNKANFSRFLHPLFGNCYTFNSAVTGQQSVKSRRPGPMHGLSLTLYVNQSAYIGTIANSAGVKVVIHEWNKQPFPEETGISVSPGQETFIGIKRHYTRRLSEPYSDNCQDNYERANIDTNMYNQRSNFSLPNLNYSQMACLKTCIQKAVELNCGCSSPNMPVSNITVDPVISTNYQVCQYKYNSTSNEISNDATCMQQRELLAFQNCSIFCKQECDEITYAVTTTTASWPSSNYERDAQRQVTMYNSDIRKEFDKLEDDEKKTFMSQNFVKFRVFYEDQLQRERTSQPSYQLLDALSDMGGQVGLWLGLSILTLFEVVEMLLDLLMLTMAKYKHKTRGKVMWAKFSHHSTNETVDCETAQREKKSSLVVQDECNINN